MSVLPHRYPFLLVDRVVDVVRGQSGVGIKNVTINEPFFQTPLPGTPMMPGVLVIEAMAQTSGVLVADAIEECGITVLFRAVTKARFRRPVFPGDQLRMHCTRNRRQGDLWQYHGQAFVDGHVAVEATFAARVIPASRR